MATEAKKIELPKEYKKEVEETNYYKLPKGVRKLISKIRREIKRDDQNCIFSMSGYVGCGKSTAAMQMQFEYDPSFTLDQISYTYEEILEKEAELPNYKGHHIDEIRFHKMDYKTAEGIMIQKVLNEIRIKNHFITCTTPQIHRTLSIFLENSDYFAQFIDKGLCIILKANNWIVYGNRFGLKPEDLKKIKDEKTFLKYFLKPAEKSETLVGIFKFPRYTRLMNETFYKEYRKVRESSSLGLIEEAKMSDKFFRFAKIMANLEKLGFSREEVCEVMEISRRTYYRMKARYPQLFLDVPKCQSAKVP